jgi:predicted HTH transcriptional regulator
MDIMLFESLISRPEGRILDFKISTYNFHDNKEVEDAKFIEDILSFCNTQRNEAAFIVTGIAEESGSVKLIGVDRFHDDAILQQKAMDKIWPKQVFSSYLFSYKEKLFGIIEFPIYPYDRPLVSTKELKGVTLDTLYIRRGSSNSPASASEIMNVIDWLSALKLSNGQMNLLKEEAGLILSALSNTLTPLSATLSRMHLYGRKTGNAVIIDFCTGELSYSAKCQNSKSVLM